jgi:hypothetical protein
MVRDQESHELFIPVYMYIIGKKKKKPSMLNYIDDLGKVKTERSA